MAWDEKTMENPARLFGQRVCENAVHESGLDKWDEFWERVALESTENSQCCFVLDLFDGFDKTVDLSSHMEVPDGGGRTVMLRLGGRVSGRIQVETVLGRGSKGGMTISGVLGGNDGLSVRVSSTQDERESEFRSRGRFVCLMDSNVEVITNGVIGEKAAKAQCIYDTKLLKIGDVRSAVGIPQIEVHRDDVIADHGFAVGGIDSEIALYMESRGISQRELERLYIKGFLKGSCG